MAGCKERDGSGSAKEIVDDVSWFKLRTFQDLEIEFFCLSGIGLEKRVGGDSIGVGIQPVGNIARSIEDKFLFAEGHGVFGRGDIVHEGREFFAEGFLEFDTQFFHQIRVMRGGDEVDHKLASLATITHDEVSQFAGMGAGGIDGEFVFVFETEGADGVERNVHLFGGKVAVVDIDGLGIATRCMEAEGEVERLFVVAGLDLHFIGGEVAQVGKGEVHFIAVAVEIFRGNAGGAFESLKSANVF